MHHRACAVFLLACCASAAGSPNTVAAEPQAIWGTGDRVQVLYIAWNSSILTYDVSPKTGHATQVGQPLVLNPPGLDGYVILTPYPDDHFVSIIWRDSQRQIHWRVYKTDQLGVPREPAVQELHPVSAEGLYGTQFVINPNGRFAYELKVATEGEQFTAELRLYYIDSATGKLTESPEVQATYGPSYCRPLLDGFNSDGRRLYDEIICDYRDANGGTYYFRSVDTDAGGLGPDEAFYDWNAGSGGGVHLVPLDDERFVVLVVPNDFQKNANYVDVFPFRSVMTRKPIIHCTDDMLPACGHKGMWVDPQHDYLFLSRYDENAHIIRIDMANHDFVDTGYRLPGQDGFDFSPNGLIVYRVAVNHQGEDSLIQVYLFDPVTGKPTPGSRISVPEQLWGVFPAERRR